MNANRLSAAGIAALALLALAACWTASAMGMGAPTENYTITDLPNSSSGYAAIQPSVKVAMLGPSTQTDNQTPSFIASFANEAGTDMVAGNETWYLDLDINSAGWLYIYEYYPPDNLQGKWIAYKWQLPQSGLWELGPFSPAPNEAVGPHIYKTWFYSNGQWAIENPTGPDDNLVTWTYARTSMPVQVPSQPPASPPQQSTTPNQFSSFITNPLVLLFGPSVIVVVVLAVWFYGKRRSLAAARPAAEGPAPARHADEPVMAEIPREISTASIEGAVSRARFSLPNGLDIRISGDSQDVGRGELARALGLDELALISRRHFTVGLAGDDFTIEDSGSANGTLLNGAEIKGKGPSVLDEGDIVEPAAAIKLTFHAQS